MNRAARRNHAKQQPRASAKPTGPSISACMIVKDEAENLDRCLGSLQGKVDEIIVVDTGSTDDSVTIATRHGAKVSHFDWCDDFAAARNASIRDAKGDWVIWVDADEELIEETPGALRLLCQAQEKPEGFLVTCRSLSDLSGTISSEIRQWRLYRNHLGFQFKGRIHEHLIHADGSTETYLLYQDAVWIRHWGYMPEPQLMRRKKARNTHLLELAVADNPSDPFMNYNVGKQHAAHHEFAQALPHLERAIQLWRETSGINHAYVGNMFALAINTSVELGDNQKAVAIEALVPSAAISPDILFQAGVAWMRLGRRDQAEPRLQRAWQDTGIRMHIEGDPSSYTWRPLAALAQIYLDAGDAAQAYKYAQQAMVHGPDLPNLLFAMALTTAKLRRFEESARHARRMIELDVNEGYKRQARRLLLNIGQGTDDPRLVVEAFSGPIEGIEDHEGVLIRANAYAEMGDRQSQYDTLDAGCKEHPNHWAIRVALVELLDEQDFTAEAGNILAAGLDLPNPPPGLYAKLALLLSKQGRYEDAANALRIEEALVSGPGSRS